VPPWLSLDRLVRDYIYRYHYAVFPVTEDGRLIGCIGTRQVKEVEPAQWPFRTAARLLAPCTPDNAVTSDTDALKALSIMRRTGISRLMVTAQGRLVGVIALKDMLRILSL
jgi:predicted transcriptional regulator